jgi:hypothetical protein
MIGEMTEVATGWRKYGIKYGTHVTGVIGI